MITRWVLSIIASFAIDVIGVFILPFAIYFSDGYTLPAWAWWWDNDREPIGDAERGYQIAIARGFKRGWLRYCWLGWRNPGSNFGYMLGVPQTTDITYQFTGDPETSDQGKFGSLFVTAYQNNKKVAFCYYSVRPSFAGQCLRIFVGWKIHDRVKDGTKAQIVCVINPFMSKT